MRIRFIAAFCCWCVFFSYPLAIAAEERYAVAVSIANVRSGPDSSQKNILWQVERYYPILVVEKAGKWYRFRDYEGDEGWISRGLVKKIRTVITTRNKCNVRSGPGTKYRKLFQVGSGIPFRVLKSQKGWFRVQHADGDVGWIYNTLVW